MAVICDKCKQPKKVALNVKSSGLDLCEDCSPLFDDAIANLIKEFTNDKKKKKSLLGDIGGALFGPKK